MVSYHRKSKSTELTSSARDTVDSVGLIPKRLPFTTSNTIIRTFRHAISLDERRAKFKANLWNRPTDEEKRLGLHVIDSGHLQNGQCCTSSASLGAKNRRGHGDSDHSHSAKRGLNIWTSNSNMDKTLSHFESKYAYLNKELTDVEEVWFAGCHCGR